MKNLFAVAAVAAMLVACGGNTTNTECTETCDSAKVCCDTTKACCDSAAVDTVAADSVAVADSTVAE